MKFRRVGIVVLKILTCVAFGSGIAASIAYIVAEDYVDDAAGFGLYVGLFHGIVWSIQPKAVRIAFVVPIMWGVVFFLMGMLLRITVIPEVIVFGTPKRPLDQMWWTRLIHMVLVSSIPLGLLVGIVRALARARGQSIKQFLFRV